MISRFSSAILRRLLPLLVLAFLSPGGRAAAAPAIGTATGSDPLHPALDHFYNLEYDAAQKELEAYLKQHPTDLRALNYLGSVILQRELFRRELLEAQVYGERGKAFQPDKAPLSPGFEQEFFGVLGKADTLAEDRLQQNPGDEEALYWAGVAHVTRAIFHLTLAKARLKALGEAKQARKYHARLLQIDPNFVDAYLVVGTYDYIVGSLPWYLKVLASLVGHHGDRERGLAEVKRVTEQGHWAQEDAKSYLAILYFREKMYPQALSLLEDLERSYPRNFLIPQEAARIYKAQERWREAASVYDAILTKHQAGAPGYNHIPLAKVLYQAGEAHSRAGEGDVALRRFEEAAKLGDNNIYVYRAELAAAGLYLQRNRRAEALRRYQRVAGAVPDTDEGRAARRSLKQLQESRSTKFEGAG
jgi:tetratricopeptide (TPR) repeat protein